MFTIKYKVMKVKRDGVNRFIPMEKRMFLGFGKWKECAGWQEAQKNAAEERFLGLETDSTLTQCRAFLDKQDLTNIDNKFYQK